MASRRALAGHLPGLLTENLPYKVLSLLLAVGLWAWVQADEVIDVRTRAQVRYVWPEGLVRARQVPKTLVVTVRGPQGVVRTIERDEVEVVVDLSDAEQGTVPVDFTELELRGLPAGVEAVQVSPPAVDVELDRALDREVAIRPTVIGQPAEGWLLAGVTVEPATAQITGPQGTVKGIALIATDVVDISGATGDRVVEASLALTERVVSLSGGTPARVKVRVDLDPVIVERTFEAAPVIVGAPGTWSVHPATARLVLSGPQTEIAAIAPDGVRVLLTPPADTAPGRAVELSWRKEADDEAVRIVLDPPNAGIELLRIEPRRFTAEPVR